MKRTTVVAISIAAALLTSCSANNQPSSTGASTTAMDGTTSFGDKVEFSGEDGSILGGLVFREVAAVPPTCLSDSSAEGNDPGQILAIKLELYAGTMEMGVPDPTTLKVNDEGGFTQTLGYGDHSCDEMFPPLTTASVGGKSQGWISVANNHPNPKSLVYIPLFLKLTGDSDIDFIQATPTNSVIAMPPIATPSAPALVTTTTTEAPTTTEFQTVAPQAPIEPTRVIVNCGYPAYANTEYSDGSRGQTDYCAAQLQASADAEREANTPSCDGTTCTYPNGATRPDERTPKTPSPWVQSQNDWIKCKNAGNSDEYCRANT